jgi:predicted homoserine dehydrogenase-like protein
MSTLRERLVEFEKSHSRPVRVGLIGAGQMGTGLMSQMEKMDGMTVVAAADVLPGRARDAFHEASVEDKLIHQVDDNPGRADELIADGQRIATTSSDMLVNLEQIDVVLEATGVPEVGAHICMAGIENKKHVVNMNVEADATIGWLLGKKAAEAGVVYSLAAGDEPGSIKEIYDFADALGFKIVAVGKGKNNKLNREANPDTVAEVANAKNMSTKMLASFADGTKTMVEMTSIGNGIGFIPEIRGAYGPNASVSDLPRVFVPKSAGGIFEGTGVVDYAVGVAPGVFVIITTDQPKIIKDLKYLRLSGHGNYWSLYRPYHLANLETPITVASVVLDQRETLVTRNAPVCETITAAKRNLKKGETVDALGGFTVYGLIEKADVARAQNLLPLGIAVGAILTQDVPKGTALTYEDVELVEESTIVQLRRQQDRMLFEES